MKKLFYIDYPQEHIEAQLHRYRCVHCKEETTTINGQLDGHLPSCEYRIKMENAGYETEGKDSTKKLVSHDADDFD
jgi:DNA-directed RNA polymerase subunit RPC12/RpoP